MEDGQRLNFKTKLLDEGSMVSLATDGTYYYLNTVRGDQEMRLKFTRAAMYAITALVVELEAERN